MAHALTKFGQVGLISFNDFDLDELLAYFGFAGLNARKRIVRRMTPSLSGDYDIFVNSTYHSQMPSQAKLSLYLHNFPSKTPSPEFLHSYHFLANSGYTKHWAEQMWGEAPFRCSVLYPEVNDRPRPEQGTLLPKTRTILSVGRLAAEGHTKNQKEIIEAFLAASAARPEIVDGWELLLLGSSNSDAYLMEVMDMARGAPIRVELDASFEVVADAYRKSLIYVHASGIGRDQQREPERFERFGMAVAQALANGCYPIVFDAAGPKEIIESAGVGVTFSNVQDLCDNLLRVIGQANRGELEDLVPTLIAQSERYSRERQCERLHEIIAGSGLDWRPNRQTQPTPSLRVGTGPRADPGE